MGSRVTSKGQVTIPRDVRDDLGLTPGCRVAFRKVGNKYVLVKEVDSDEEYLKEWRGSIDLEMTVDNFVSETRTIKRTSRKRGARRRD